jgi:hypothetical protein
MALAVVRLKQTGLGGVSDPVTAIVTAIPAVRSLPRDWTGRGDLERTGGASAAIARGAPLRHRHPRLS